MMHKEMKTIQVDAEPDIVSARMHVRNLARRLGFSTKDQARVSLATSSLAHFLDIGGKYKGEISFGCSNGNSNASADTVGMQVVCTVFCADPAYKLNKRGLSKVQWMVDDLDVASLPSDDVQVTLIKWK
jgi:hypothetical protein